MASLIPLAVQMIGLLPGAIDSVLKIVDAVKSDPATPDEEKAKLEDISARLNEALERVKSARLPAPQ